MMTTMTKNILAIALILGLGAGTAAPVAAQSNKAGEAAGRKLIEAVFSEAEETVIREWYDKRWGEGGIESPSKDVDNTQARGNQGKGAKGGKGMPPGLAKRERLPPGLQKRLDVGEPLPPGLAKRDLPPPLKGQLPARTDQHEVKVIDNDVVLIDKTTQVLLDIIKDVFTPRHQTR